MRTLHPAALRFLKAKRAVFSTSMWAPNYQALVNALNETGDTLHATGINAGGLSLDMLDAPAMILAQHVQAKGLADERNAL